MSRRPAVITQADVTRAIRAAKKAGAAAVELHIGQDAKIVVRIDPSTAPDAPLEPQERIVL